jgi:hypothetical protein
VLWERVDPLTHYNDVDFHQNFRFTKENLQKVVDLIKDDIEFHTKRGCPLNPVQQICLAMTFFASGSFQHVSGYMAGVKKSTACMTIRRVARALVAKSDQLIAMPTRAEMRSLSEKHVAKYGVPNAPLGVDGTHIRLGRAPSQAELPAGIVPQDFFCRKQNSGASTARYKTINILLEFEHNRALLLQVVADGDMIIRSIDARWAGKTHDSRVWRGSVAKQVMEAQTEFCIVADSAYPMSRTLLKPFSRREATTPNHGRFNHKLSGLRTILTENPIGIWKQRFPILRY